MSATKTDGAIRGLERIKADFEMRGANATTIERAIDCIRSLASKDTALAKIRAENERLQKLVNAFKDDGLVQAAIARQTFLQEERDDAIAELAEFDEANRMLVKSADGWRDKFRAADAERDALKKHNDGLVVLFEKFHAQKEAAESELARVKKALEEATLLLEGFAPLTDPDSHTRRFLASRSISQDGEERT